MRREERRIRRKRTGLNRTEQKRSALLHDRSFKQSNVRARDGNGDERFKPEGYCRERGMLSVCVGVGGEGEEGR